MAGINAMPFPKPAELDDAWFAERIAACPPPLLEPGSPAARLLYATLSEAERGSGRKYGLDDGADLDRQVVPAATVLRFLVHRSDATIQLTLQTSSGGDQRAARRLAAELLGVRLEEVPVVVRRHVMVTKVRSVRYITCEIGDEGRAVHLKRTTAPTQNDDTWGPVPIDVVLAGAP